MYTVGAGKLPVLPFYVDLIIGQTKEPETDEQELHKKTLRPTGSVAPLLFLSQGKGWGLGFKGEEDGSQEGASRCTPVQIVFYLRVLSGNSSFSGTGPLSKYLQAGKGEVQSSC